MSALKGFFCNLGVLAKKHNERILPTSPCVFPLMYTVLVKRLVFKLESLCLIAKKKIIFSELIAFSFFK